MNKGKKIVFSILITLIVIASVVYTTYAFFNATKNSTGDNIAGSTNNSSFSVTSSVVYKATKLIPVSEATLNATVNKTSNNCRDNDNRDTCSLYQINVVNGTVPLTLYGFVRTNSSTYTTTNLKYKVFTKSGNTYTAITDALTLSHNSGDSVYFKLNNTNVTTNIAASGTQTYYIAFFINEINSSQNDDQNKDYSCKIGFEGTDGAELSVVFNV